MTVSSQVSRADYNGNGVTTLFSVPFYFVDPTHLTVLSTVIATGVSTVLTLATNYTVSGTGVSTGGSVTLLVAPAGTVRITILRNVPYLQNTHYVPNDPFPATSHEAALDLLTMEAQQINEILSRTVTFPSSDPTGIGATIPNSVSRAGKVFTFDSTGAPSVTNNAVDVTAVAANATNINTVSANIGSVNSVAGNATNINTVASNNTNVTNVGANIANVNSVAANATNINTNATNIVAIQNASANATAAGNSATAAGNSATAAAGSASAAYTSATNSAASYTSFHNQYQGAYSTPPTLRPDSSALQTGDLYFNTTSSAMFVRSASGWIAAGSSVNGTTKRFKYIASAGQTTFTGADANSNVLAYDSGYIDAYLNGIRLDATDFTASSGTSFVLSAAASANDELNIVAFGTFSVSNFDGAGINAATVSPTKLVNSGAELGMRNRIINGGMVVNQRATSVTSSGYFVDRWQYQAAQASKGTAQQSSTAPTGFVNSLQFTSSSSYSVLTGDYFIFDQPIEGFNTADLGWGTASAKTITISAWVYSSLTGTFGGAVQNSAGNRSYPFTYSIPTANTWTQISVTIAGDTAGTWNTTNGVGIFVSFGLGCGATFSGTAGSWAGTNYLSATGASSVVGTSGATFYITGVQLEKGPVATPFEYRPYGTELALCQRYYEQWNINGGVAGYIGAGVGLAWTTNNARIQLQYQVPKRTAPTSSASGTITWGTGAVNTTQTAFSFDSPSINHVLLYGVTASSVLTQGGAIQAYVLNTSTFTVNFSAEL